MVLDHRHLGFPNPAASLYRVSLESPMGVAASSCVKEPRLAQEKAINTGSATANITEIFDEIHDS